MRTSNLVIGVVLLAAGVAAGILIDYPPSEDALDGDNNLVTVIVAKVDIPANQRLDALLKQPKRTFEEVQIPAEMLVSGVVTDLDMLIGTITATPILANEQVSTSRLSSADTPYAGTILPS